MGASELLEKMVQDCKPMEMGKCAEEVEIMASRVMRTVADASNGAKACSRKSFSTKCVEVLQTASDSAETSHRSAYLLQNECTALKSIYACNSYAAYAKHHMDRVRKVFAHAVAECEIGRLGNEDVDSN